MKVLFDSNVIIDALSNRANSNLGSKTLFIKATSYEIEGYIAAKQITDIYYVLKRYLKDEEKISHVLNIIVRVFEIIPVTKTDLLDAFEIGGPDYEDDLLFVLAKNNDIDYIATNNIKHFNSLIAITPQDLLTNKKI